ncbi:acyl-CoA thioesterase [Paraburkholderia megapolitana]|uniref:acyl-CoA thioesterase n=1 Tax=Paraburkholderia megapolitana TaxID=420953 RepID=UPI0038B8CCBF
MMSKSFQTNVEVRYRDTDSMGHVSSPVYYDYMQYAYLEYMHSILEIPKSKKLPHIMVKTSCEYISQAKYGDKLRVLSAITKYGTKSFEMEHVMHIDDDKGEVVAKATSVHVMYDYDKHATYAVPEAFKHTIQDFQGAL